MLHTVAPRLATEILDSLTKKATDRYNPDQVKVEVNNLLTTVLFVGRTDSHYVSIEDELYDVSDYAFTPNLVTLANFCRVFVSTGSMDKPFFRMDVPVLKTTVKVKVRDGNEEKWVEKVVEGKVLTPNQVKKVFVNWNSIDSNAGLKLAAPVTYVKKDVFLSEVRTACDVSGRYVDVVSPADDADHAVSALLGLNPWNLDVGEYACRVVSIRDLAHWLVFDKSSNGSRD